MPSAMEPARSRWPMPTVRPLKTAFSLSRSSYSWIRPGRICRSSRTLSTAPAGADVRVVHPKAGDHLEDVEDQFAVAEPEGHHGQRADLHAAGGQADHV